MWRGGGWDTPPEVVRGWLGGDPTPWGVRLGRAAIVTSVLQRGRRFIDAWPVIVGFSGERAGDAGFEAWNVPRGTLGPSQIADVPSQGGPVLGPRLLSWEIRERFGVFIYPKRYQVVVVGGGHAGLEAGMAAARLGCQTLMLTQNLDTIGQMSCNPAIGGLAKGHMVREIDALGGVMGLNTDATGIQFRTLNSNKGPSVRAPRAQCDKKAYQFRMKALVEAEPNLDLLQGNVLRILAEGGGVQGIETTLGWTIQAETVIITTGTFMRGLLHVGLKNQTGGRMGDAVSTLSESLQALGFEIGRFKTGTPCRLNARSIDLKRCERQDGDDPPPRFSFRPEQLVREADNLFTLNEFVDGLFHVETNSLLDHPHNPSNTRSDSGQPGQVADVHRTDRGYSDPLLPFH